MSQLLTLGVLTQAAYDVDAQAFITATGITDQTIIKAINTFVINMKLNNLWIKMTAIYPFVGGTATTHKYNLKDPRDLDAAFRLVFSNCTHSSNGVLPSGSGSGADTFIFKENISQNSFHTSFYSRTNVAKSEAEISWILNSGTSLFNSIVTRYGNIAYFGANSGQSSVANTDSTGFYIVSRNEATKMLRCINATAVEVSSNSGVPTTTQSMSLFCQKTYAGSTTLYSTKQCAFSSVGTGLTSAELTTFSTIVNTLQTALSRNIY